MELIALVVLIAALFALESTLYRRLMFRNLEYRYRFNRAEAYEGDEIELIEEVSNEKWLPIPWFKSEMTTSKWLEFAKAQSIVTDQIRFVPSFFVLKSHRKVTRTWRVKCMKRGIFESKVILLGTDLLGFVSQSKQVEKTAKLRVLPSPANVEALSYRPQIASGNVTVRRHLVEDPFTFAGIREYSERDPINRIHWAATAKEQHLMVYNTEYAVNQSITVLLNTQSRQFEREHVVDRSSVEKCIKVCAAVFQAAAAAGIPMRVMSNCLAEDKRFYLSSSVGSGREHAVNLLRLMAAVPLRDAHQFEGWLKYLESTINTTEVVLVSSYLSPEMLEFSHRKAAEGVLVKILLTKKDYTDLELHGAEVFYTIFGGDYS